MYGYLSIWCVVVIFCQKTIGQDTAKVAEETAKVAEVAAPLLDAHLLEDLQKEALAANPNANISEAAILAAIRNELPDVCPDGSAPLNGGQYCDGLHSGQSQDWCGVGYYCHWISHPGICCPLRCPNGDVPLVNINLNDDHFLESCTPDRCPAIAAGYECVDESIWGTLHNPAPSDPPVAPPHAGICCPPKEDSCETCEIEYTVGFQQEYNGEQCCFYWGRNASCSGCCESSSSVSWMAGQSPIFKKDCECCMPNGRYRKTKAWKICLVGPDLDPSQVCTSIPALSSLPPWFTCTSISYLLPTGCDCRNCELLIPATSNPDQSVPDGDAELPSDELLIAQAQKFIKEQTDHMKKFLRYMKNNP